MFEPGVLTPISTRQHPSTALCQVLKHWCVLLQAFEQLVTELVAGLDPTLAVRLHLICLGEACDERWHGRLITRVKQLLMELRGLLVFQVLTRWCCAGGQSD